MAAEEFRSRMIRSAMRSSINLLVFAISAIASAQQTSVLFIGNSYTYVNDLPNTFRQLALSLGDTVVVGSSVPGGYTLQLHSAYAPTLAAIDSSAWDYVVMQEQSQLPSFPQSQVQSEVYPYAALLVDSILANDSCTQPVFYMTSGRENGDTVNCPTWPPVCTYDGMQAQLRMSYLHMADTNAAFCSPVGVAWKHVRDTHPTINLYNADQSHPSPEGTYLAACVFYSTLFRSSSVGASFVASLPADTAAILQQIASATVLDSLSTWNIGVNDPDAGFTVDWIDGCIRQFHSLVGGSNWWDFGDGTNSSGTDPLHVFTIGQDLIVTHAVVDACGRTDTTTMELLVCPESIAEQGPMSRIKVVRIEDAVGFSGLWIDDIITFSDALGRSMLSRTSGVTTTSIPCPPGLTIWRVTDREGRSITGRIINP